MKTNPEYDKFSKAMDTILKANPAVVKSAMEAEKRERQKINRIPGKRGPGRPRKVSHHV